MVLELQAASIAPQVTWGTNPGMVTDVTGKVPEPDSFRDPVDRKAAAAAIEGHFVDIRTWSVGRTE